ncbi:1583_t:CDS:1, partial [Funneliformis geosporum]
YSASSDYAYFVILDFHSSGDKNYYDDGVESSGIQMQDVIPHYIHLSVVYLKI